MPHVIAVVQARLGSSRLPGKVLANLSERPLLWHVLRRVRAIPGLDHLILTTPEPDNAVLKTYAPWGIDAWAPHEPPDVLSGFARANSWGFKVDAILRITGDCPLLDPGLCEAVLKRVLGGLGHSDVYATNALETSFGLDCQAFTAEALRRAHVAAEGADREHVCPWMERELKPISYVLLPEEVRTVRWAVDTAEDLDRVQAIYAHLPPGDFSWQATLRAAREAGV